MYYRVTVIHFDPSKRDAFYAAADATREEMKAIEGIQSIRSVEVADGEAIVFAEYQTQEQADKARPTVQRILGGALGSFMVKPPDMKAGPVTWEM